MRKKRPNGVIFPNNPFHGRNQKLKRSLSAALIASAMMAGSTYAQSIDAPVTISGTEVATAVTVSGGGVIDGAVATAPTIVNSGYYDVTSGAILGVDLTGSGEMVKWGSGTFQISSGENGSSWTGKTLIYGGIFQTVDDEALSQYSDVELLDSAVLDMKDTYQKIGSLGDAFSDYRGGEVLLGVDGYLALGYTNTSTTFSGKLSGEIDTVIEKNGTGTWTLTGDSDFEGTLDVRDGAVQLGDGITGSLNNLDELHVRDGSSFVLNLVNGGVFAPNSIHLEGKLISISSGTTTIDATTTPLTGNGGQLIQAGFGQTILLGDFEHSGLTSVLKGMLQLGDGITSATLSQSEIFVGDGAALNIKLPSGDWFENTVQNDGWVIVSGPGVTKVDAIISGTGAFIIDSPTGMTRLYAGKSSGPQYTYTGPTMVLSGTLSTEDDYVLPETSAVFIGNGTELDLTATNQSIGSLSGAGDVNLTESHLVVGNDNTNAWFGGSIYDNGVSYGSVEKVGTGIWVLDGINTYNGGTVVAEGAIVVGSTADSPAFLAGNVDVAEGAALAGHGVIGGSVWNEGIILPGALKPGTLYIGGDYEQADTGYLVARIESKSKHSLLDVGGDAYLDGKLIVARTGKSVRPGDRVTILEAEGDVFGAFSKVLDANETMVGLRALYGDDTVEIEFFQKSFAGLSGLSANQKKVAKALDRIIGKQKVRGLVDHLNNESIDSVKNDIALLSPEAYTAIFNIGFATAQIQAGNIERRLEDLRNGACGFSANGLALSNSRGSLKSGGMPIVNERDGLTLAGWDGYSVAAPSTLDLDNRWAFFATGSGEWADIKSTPQVHGAEFNTGGVTIGADYRVSENLVVGISGSYANTSSDLWRDGSLDVNSGRGALYASAFNGGAYVNGLIGGGYNSYKTRYATVGGNTSRGDTNSGEFDALLGGGYDFRTGGFTVGPVGSLQYTYIGLNSFTETGAFAPMAFPSQSQNSLRSALGARASYAFVVGEMVIRPEIRAQWAHEFLNSTTAIEAGFAAGGGAFRVNGQSIGRDSLLVDAGVTLDFSPAYSVFAYYTGEIGRTNYSSNGVNGGFRVSF